MTTGGVKPWAGKAVGEARRLVATWLPRPCGKCGKTVYPDPPNTSGKYSGWVIGHIRDRVIWPELTWDVSNWQVEHRACSDASGQDSVIRKAKADALRAAGITDPAALARVLDAASTQVNAVFPGDGGPGKPPPLSVSLPGHEPTPEPTASDQLRTELTWSAFVKGPPAYIRDLLEIPADSAPPLAMTPPHPRAAGTYGWEVVEDIEREDRRPLRWWQKLLLVRMLEHDSEGVLCWRYILFSGPRRIGKSHVSRGLMNWRLGRGRDLFGERQMIVHTAMDLYVCRRVLEPAQLWAGRKGWRVVTANGKEAIYIGADDDLADAWVIKAPKSAGHSDDVTLGFVDEAWDVTPRYVDDGLIPAMVDRLSPQLLLTSTANRRATSLLPTNISAALAEDTMDTLLMLWGAPADADMGALEVWRAASPHWSADRESAMRMAYNKAIAGEAMPELDDPDPVEGFKSQWLNQWKLIDRLDQRGDPIIEVADWAALTMPATPARTPDRVAIASWSGAGVSVARAWKLEDQVVVDVEEQPTLAAAMVAARSRGYRRRVIVPKDLADELSGPREPMPGRAAAAVDQLAALLRDSRIRHTGAEHLTDQVLAARTVDRPDGLRLTSEDRADAIKAATWAAEGALAARGRGPRKMVTARVSSRDSAA